MKKTKMMLVGTLSAFCLMFSVITENTISHAADISENVQSAEQLSSNKMLLSVATGSTGLLTNTHTYYDGSKPAMTLKQEVNWTYGGSTGSYPIAIFYDFGATPAAGYSYTSVQRLSGEKIYYNGKTATRYKEIGKFSGNGVSGDTCVYVVCNCDGEHYEHFI